MQSRICDEIGDDHPSDTFKILLATDNHLGFAEKDPERRDDSFVTFEEILSLAQQHDVDFILLGGDLFHENKPSRYVLHRCAELLRKHTLGNKPVEFEVLNELQSSLHYPVVNYEDPNLNVSYPVFSIHGNHDDPAGLNSLCALDVLSAMGLINHFGKCVNLDKIEIKPLLLQKGCTKLALYGLGSIRDERLHRIFQERKVSMIRPLEDTDKWFNLFVIHQNRYKHTQTNYIPDYFLDDFLDLVIWGHEHECLITPQESSVKEFFVTQPGSSVATSLCSGESVEKSVGILHIYKQNFKIEEIPLKSVRPFVYDEIDLHNGNLKLSGKNVSKKCMDYCESHVERLIENAKKLLSGDNHQPSLPLVRLKVGYKNDEETFSIYRFGQKFHGRVANPKDIVLFHRQRSSDGLDKSSAKGKSLIDSIKLNEQDLIKFSAIELVQDHFKKADEGFGLKLLTATGLGRAVKEFVDKEEKESINELVNHQERKVQEFLLSHQVDIDNIDNEIQHFREEKQRKDPEDDAEVNEALKMARQKRMEGPHESDHDDIDNNDMEHSDISMNASTSVVAPTSSRSRRGRGARRSNSSSTGRRSTPTRAKYQRSIRQYDDSDIVEIEDNEPETILVSKRPKQESGKRLRRPGVIFSVDSDD